MSISTQEKSFARLWLLSGVAALALAGLFSLVLVVARTPALAKLPLFSRLFHEALVVHVDLSVLAWFLSVACMFWGIQSSSLRAAGEAIQPSVDAPGLLRCARNDGNIIEKSAFISFVLGMTLLALSPLDPAGEALMSNYIPVIASPVFFLGLSLLMCGLGLQLVHYFVHARPQGVEGFAAYTAALITLIALLAFVWSYFKLPPVFEGVQYYEMLFWAGGHVLQFTHTQFLILCWFLLACALKPSLANVRQPVVLFALALGLVALIAPLIFAAYDITSAEFRQSFTWLMAAGGVGSAVAALWALRHLAIPASGERALFTSLLMSLALFLYGGVLALMIHGQNVTIPAHYHGSIVGVTLAFCGVAYLMLPRFGYANPSGWRLAYWQPVVYGAGQIMHISGLAWSGGYGVLRKTPGGLENADIGAKIAMGLMGAGGLVAIIGGFMFVVAVYRSVRRGTTPG